MSIEAREMAPTDEAFVLDTWIESEEDHARIQGTRGDVFAALRAKARTLLPASRVVIAAPAGDPLTVLGWMAIDMATGDVHYAYTRRRHRRQGVQRFLAESAAIKRPLVATCAPPRKGAIRGVTYHPAQGWVRALMERSA